MKVVCCAINSRFSQTNPAIRSLALYTTEHWSRLWQDMVFAKIAAQTLKRVPFDPIIREYPTVQPVDRIARDLFRCAGDIYAFSCYIWNRRLIMDVIVQLRRMLPHAQIVIGGPEVSFDAPMILSTFTEIDYVLAGEGEDIFARLMISLAGISAKTNESAIETVSTTRSLAGESESQVPASAAEALSKLRSALLKEVPSLTWRDQSQIKSNAPPDHPLDMALLPFPYDWDLNQMSDRMLYYESSRGCPFCCTYCLSSIDRTIRYRPLEQTLTHLDRLLQANVRLVKFVDRTFNSDPQRAQTIWMHLINRHQEQPTRTCFHFEIAADLLTDKNVEILTTAPEGLFQLEIGIQTTNPATLARIKRKCNLPQLIYRVRQLVKAGRQHLHIDQIAGLPGENIDQIIMTFNQLYDLKTDHLQLGFLKILPGTPILIGNSECSYTFQPFPPYEVLSSRELPAAAFCQLHDVESALEQFANSGIFRLTLPHLLCHFTSPYAFFLELAADLERNGESGRGLSTEERASILSRFAKARLNRDEHNQIEGLLRYDHYRFGRKDVPTHLNALEATATPCQKKRITDLRRQLLPGLRNRIESYPFSVEQLLSEGRLISGDTWVIYDLSGPAPVIISILPCGSI